MNFFNAADNVVGVAVYAYKFKPNLVSSRLHSLLQAYQWKSNIVWKWNIYKGDSNVSFFIWACVHTKWKCKKSTSQQLALLLLQLLLLLLLKLLLQLLLM